MNDPTLVRPRKRPFLAGASALVVLVVAACSGPTAVMAPPTLTDADLDGAAALTEHDGLALGLSSLGAADIASSAVLDGSARLGVSPLFADSLDEHRNGHGRRPSWGKARKSQPDEGGWLVYLEQKGKEYAIRLVDLNDENAPKRHGDQVVYRGSRAIQSVAVSRDGRTIAFIAATKNGDNDLFLLDVRRGKVRSTRTPTVDERDVSMSLHGEALVWQGGSAAEPTVVWYYEGVGKVELAPADWTAILGTDPLYLTQPSISGDGLSVTFVERSGSLAQAIGYPALPTIGVF